MTLESQNQIEKKTSFKNTILIENEPKRLENAIWKTNNFFLTFHDLSFYCLFTAWTRAAQLIKIKSLNYETFF